MPDSWFRRFHPVTDPVAELVCFPYAGGAASSWYALSAALAPTVAVSAVQYPGRHDRHREPAVEDLHVLAERITAALGPAGPRPRVLFGHSMGASVAYEVAVRQVALGAGPAALIVSGRRGPGRRRAELDGAPTDDAILARVRALGGAAPELLADAEVRDLILPALRGDYRALIGYRDTAGPPLPCPVLALAGERDPEAPPADVEAWRGRAGGDFTLRVFPGGHFFLDERPAAAAAAVGGWLTALVPPAAPARPGT